MKASELAAVIQGIAPVVRDYVTKSVGEVVTRVAAVEARQPAPGPQGEAGPAGPVGPAGGVGEPGPAGVVPEAWLERLAALEARIAEPVPAWDADEMTKSLTDLLRKELGAVPLRMQKRVIRDEHGRVDRVVEEPAIS